MYGKIFSSLYQGTLRGRAHEILVFTNMIACADRDGIVDKHPRAISEEVGLSLEQTNAAISNLEMPDKESRSAEHGGARIVQYFENRVWGWEIVNYVKYRDIRNNEERRESNKLAQRKHRQPSAEKMTVTSCHQMSSDVITGHQMSSPSAHAEGDADTDVDSYSLKKEKNSRFTFHLSDSTPWTLPQVELDALVSRHPGVDVPAELDKVSKWLTDNPKKRWKASGIVRALSSWLKKSKPGSQDAPTTTPMEKFVKSHMHRVVGIVADRRAALEELYAMVVDTEVEPHLTRLWNKIFTGDSLFANLVRPRYTTWNDKRIADDIIAEREDKRAQEYLAEMMAIEKAANEDDAQVSQGHIPPF